MSCQESYSTLNKEQLNTKLEILTEQYWNALDLVASLVCERAVIMDLIQAKPSEAKQ